MQAFVIFICVLTVLIIVHELGHFAVGIFLEVNVKKFSVGFGKELIGVTWKGIRFSYNLIPIGGYVIFLGENGNHEIKEDNKKYAFCNKPIWVRSCIFAAGPLANLFFAWFVFSLFYAIIGIPEPDLRAIGDEIVQGGPAYEAGIQRGDQILKIDDQDVFEWPIMVDIINKSKGKELLFTVARGKEFLLFKISPEKNLSSGNEDKPSSDYKIGITKTSLQIFKPAKNYFSAAAKGFETSFQICADIFQRLTGIFFKKEGMDSIGGPMTIAKVAKDQYNQGIQNLFYLMGILSVNLFFFNLLPIPMLDGGQLTRLFIEKIRKKPFSRNTQIITNTTGLMIIGLILYVAVFSDIVNFLSYH